MNLGTVAGELISYDSLRNYLEGWYLVRDGREKVVDTQLNYVKFTLAPLLIG